MIPKIIHYCWFGGNPKPEIIEKCIESWRKYCPDWEIIEWNESNFDVNSYPFTKEAYAAKKWAFVSDVARLETVYKHGGVYLDTDVEFLTDNPLQTLLDYDNILVFETERAISSGLCLGGSIGSNLCKELLVPYLNTIYTKETETINSVANKPIFNNLYPDLKWDGQTQIHNNTYIMGVAEYCKIMRHHGTRSWCDNLPKYKISGFVRLKKVLRNPKIFSFLENKRFLKKLVPIYEFLVYDLLDLGPIYYFKRLILKIKNRNKS